MKRNGGSAWSGIYKYPWYSPYQFAGNRPIRYIDIDGLEESNNNKPGENINGINTAAVDNTCRPRLDLLQPHQFGDATQKEDQEKMSALAIPEVVAPSLKYATEKTFENGYWIGKTTKNEYKLFSPAFKGSQYVEKTTEYTLKFSRGIEVGGVIVHALVIAPSLYKALVSEDAEEKMEAMDELKKNLAVMGIEVVNAPAGIAVIVADQIIHTEEFKMNQIQNAREKSKEYKSKDNFRAYKYYQKLEKSRDQSQDEISPKH